MKKLFFSIALLIGARPLDAQLVQNGSFELPGCGSGVCGSPAITSWTTFGSVETIANNFWLAGAGSVSLDLNGIDRGGIGQTVNGLTIGAKYDLSFLLSRNGGVSSASLDVLWLQTAPSTSSNFFNAASGVQFTSTGPVAANAMNWTAQTTQFTATQSSMFLGFRSLVLTNVWGPALDNVALVAAPVSSVPEPSTFALMASGLLAIGIMSRRRGTV